tara:strand:- start:3966 stop:5516 length:1551 start_codon:yes stop_codon:yes gene_type:complete
MKLGLGANISAAASSAAATWVYPMSKAIRLGLKAFFDFRYTENKFVGSGSGSFSGTNQYLQISNASVKSAIEGSEELSIAFWASRSAQGGVPIAKGSYNVDDTDFGIEFQGHSNNRTRFTFGLDDRFALWHVPSKRLTTIDQGTGSAYTEEWIHYCFSYSSLTHEAVWYVNGETDTGGAKSGDSWPVVPSNDIDITIGTNHAGGADFQGKMKNIAIWNRKLSSVEVSNIMYKGYGELNGEEKTNLQMWMPLESDANFYNNAGTSVASTNNGVTFNSGFYNNNAPRKPRMGTTTLSPYTIGSGNAYFNGTSDHIDIPDADAFTDSDGFSFSLWVNITSNYGGVRTFISKHADFDAPANSGEFYLYNEDGRIKMKVIDHTNSAAIGGYTEIIMPTSFRNRGWNHIAFTWNGGTSLGDFHIYFNGRDEYLTANNNGSGFSSINNTTEKLIFGQMGDGGEPFQGRMSQISYWSRALSQDEVISIREKTYDQLSDKTGLVSYWPLESNANDVHGSNHGSLQ